MFEGELGVPVDAPGPRVAAGWASSADRARRRRDLSRQARWNRSTARLSQLYQPYHHAWQA